MNSRTEQALAYFHEGYNCAQAVFAAWADKYGIDKETALRISSSFGGGIGRMREVCGAASGMFMVVGMETGAVDGADKDGKLANYEKVRALADRFRAQNGSLICRELLTLHAQASPARSCADMVRIASELLAEEFGE